MMTKSVFQENLDELGKDIASHLKRTQTIIEKKLISGPSLYFHQKAIEAAEKDFLGSRHLEMIYAVLPAWGMHNTGEHPTKVIPFGEFESQINKIANKLKKLKERDVLSIEKENMKDIVDLLFEIDVSESESRVVSSSKTLHHVLPNLIPPIDRKYSVIGFMGRSWRYFNDKDANKKQRTKRFENDIAMEFVIGMKTFIKKHGDKMLRYKDDKFNTSLPKIFDNLVIAFVKYQLKKLD